MRPNLEHLRKQAKALLSDLRAGRLAAAKTLIDHLPSAQAMTADDVRRANWRLADAQSAIARKSGFANWPGLTRHVEQLRALEGEWAVTNLETDGASMPAAAFARSRLLIDGDSFRMESPEATYEGIFNIGVEYEPMQIDIEFVEGPEAGEWSYGIFALDGDALTFCLGLVGSPRPEAFATSAGSGHALEHLYRVAHARPAGVTGGTPSSAPKNRTRAAATDVDEAAFELKMTPLLERLQGQWAPTSLVTAGKPMEEQWLAYGSRTQTGNETKVVFGGQTMVHALMRIDETVSPVAIDYLNIGKGTRTVSHGVMEIDASEWRICMASAGDPRPADFSCDKGSGRTLSRWTRK
jgi:uncharacterized protein (TIGR03067 family)